MRILFVLVCVLMSTARTAAQETVPKELMAVLMRGAAPGDFDLRVGPPPAGFPTDVLPKGAEIGVSAVSDRMTTVAGTVSGNIDRFEEEQRLTKLGWSAAMPRPYGFVSTSAEQPLSLCQGADFVTLHYFPRPAGGQFVRASVTRDPRRSCTPRPPGAMGFADVKLPPLTPPPGVRSYASGAGASLDHMDSQGRLEQKIAPRAAAEHYAKLMVDAGWTLEGITTGGDTFAVARFTTKSSVGDAITGFIAVTSLSGTEEMDLLLHIVRNKSDRRFPPASNSLQFGIIK